MLDLREFDEVKKRLATEGERDECIKDLLTKRAPVATAPASWEKNGNPGQRQSLNGAR